MSGGASSEERPRATARRGENPVVDLEIVADRTKGSRADEGFLRVRRLTLRSVFADGTRSRPYACDIMSRARVDAVAIVVFEASRPSQRGRGRGRRAIRVALKSGVRAPIFLRRRVAHTQPDEREFGPLAEIVAGMIEPDDAGPAGIASRATTECDEEIGVRVAARDVVPLGASSFPSPGVTDEKVYFRAVEARLAGRRPPSGDGSAMEQGGGVVVMTLRDAIEACRRGEIPDMKTEIALLRLCDLLGYVPSLDRFVDEMPADLRAAWRPLGVERTSRRATRLAATGSAKRSTERPTKRRLGRRATRGTTRTRER